MENDIDYRLILSKELLLPALAIEYGLKVQPSPQSSTYTFEEVDQPFMTITITNGKSATLTLNCTLVVQQQITEIFRKRNMKYTVPGVCVNTLSIYLRPIFPNLLIDYLKLMNIPQKSRIRPVIPGSCIHIRIRTARFKLTKIDALSNISTI